MKHDTVTCMPLSLCVVAPQGLPALYEEYLGRTPASYHMVIAVLISNTVAAITGILCVRLCVLPICYQMFIIKTNETFARQGGIF